jgi:hypothetical protein
MCLGLLLAKEGHRYVLAKGLVTTQKSAQSCGLCHLPFRTTILLMPGIWLDGTDLNSNEQPF